MREVYKVGRKLPAHCTSLGQALLAELTREEVDDVLPTHLEVFTENTVSDYRALHAELERVRQRGWAYELEQTSPGVACVACVFDYRIPATDAVSCSMPAELTADADKLEDIAQSVVKHSHRLAAVLRREGIR